jgi:hypothetical protein
VDALASLQAAYPDIKQLPADWRDFLAKSDAIKVALFPGQRDVPFTARNVALDGDSVMWTGIDAKGATLMVLANARGHLDSLVIGPAIDQFRIHTEPDGTTKLEQKTPDQIRCGGFSEELRAAAKAAEPMSVAAFDAVYTDAATPQLCEPRLPFTRSAGK